MSSVNHILAGNRLAESIQLLTGNDGYHCDFAARKPIVLRMLADVDGQQCKVRAPLSLLDVYQFHEPDLSSSSLTPWALAVLDLERDGLIETWTRNAQLFMKLTDAGAKRVRSVPAPSAGKGKAAA